jgi:hypothetical protein
MSRLKIGLNHMNVLEEIAFARQVVTKMTGNATFTTPLPALAAITTAADDTEAAYQAMLAARIAAKQATATVQDKQGILTDLLKREGAYVQHISAGDRVKIESAGFSVTQASGAPQSLPAPADVQLNANVNPGNMGIRWKPVHGAASYVVERAADATPADYVVAANTTVAKALVNTMTSGQRYWFRVAAVNAKGIGEWTLPVSKIAP